MKARLINNRKALALIESLIALTIFAVVVLASLEFFGTVRKAFFKLRDGETAQESGRIALDKMKTDILLAGRGLIEAMELDIVVGIESDGAVLTVRCLSKITALQVDAAAGEKTISATDADGLSAGKEVCLLNKTKGEAAAITSTAGRTVTLDTPLSDNYPSGETRVLVLEKIAYSLDSSGTTIRRKVNASSAQPLLEGIRLFVPAYDITKNLASVNFAVTSGTGETFSLSAFAKNIALARRD